MPDQSAMIPYQFFLTAPNFFIICLCPLVFSPLIGSIGVKMQEKQHNLEPFQSKIFTWMHSINRKWFFFIDAAELFSEMDPTNI